MKSLILMRHSESPYGNIDHDRGLSQYGEELAEQKALILAADYPVIDLALVSSAKRTRLSLAILSKHIVFANSEITKNLYLTNVDEYLSEIYATDNTVEKLLIVGHNPTITTLAMQIIPQFNMEFSPSSVLIINFEANSYNQLFEVKKEHSFIK